MKRVGGTVISRTRDTTRNPLSNPNNEKQGLTEKLLYGENTR